MPKNAVFEMELEAQLHKAFITEVALEDRTASQVMSDLIRNYINERQDARSYREYLRRKVDAARVSMHNGKGMSNDELEMIYSARRKQAMEEG